MSDCRHPRDRDIRLSRTQTSAVSEHANKNGHYPLWDKVKFIDRDPYWYSRRVKEAIHVRLHLNNINRDSGIEIPKAWMPTIRQHDNRSLPQGTAEGSVDGLLTVANITDPKMQGRDGSKNLAKKVNLRSLGLHCDYSY